MGKGHLPLFTYPVIIISLFSLSFVLKAFICLGWSTSLLTALGIFMLLYTNRKQQRISTRNVLIAGLRRTRWLQLTTFSSFLKEILKTQLHLSSMQENVLIVLCMLSSDRTSWALWSRGSGYLKPWCLCFQRRPKAFYSDSQLTCGSYLPACHLHCMFSPYCICNVADIFLKQKSSNV